MFLNFQKYLYLFHHHLQKNHHTHIHIHLQNRHLLLIHYLNLIFSYYLQQFVFYLPSLVIPFLLVYLNLTQSQDHLSHRMLAWLFIKMGFLFLLAPPFSILTLHCFIYLYLNPNYHYYLHHHQNHPKNHSFYLLSYLFLFPPILICYLTLQHNLRIFFFQKS